jgi:Tol biopolymer transport system component
MTDLENLIRESLRDPRRQLPGWPDPMPRIRRAARRQYAGLASATAVLLAGAALPLALLTGLGTHGYAGKPSATPGPPTAHTPPPRSAKPPPYPEWAERLGGEVAYQCGDVICLMRPDGTGQRGVPGNGPLPLPEWDPAWSPDGSQLSFRGYYGQGDGQYDLYAVSATGCRPTRLTRGLNGESSAWSPSGRQIVFSVPLGLYVISSDGAGLHRLIANPTKISYGVDTPAWSALNRIAFASYVGTHTTEIYAVTADGTGQVALTHGGNGFSSPSWSPDGNSIAFVAGPYTSSVVDVASADGTGVRQLSPSSWISYSPTWTPGGQVVFLRQLQAPTDYTAAVTSAYIVNRDGTRLRLLYPDLNASQIAWGPRTLWPAAC